MANLLTNPELTVKLLKALQIGARALPYVVAGAINETGGVKKNAKRVKDKVDEYNAAHPDKAVQNTNTGAAPKTIGNQSSVNPAWTHIFNPATGKIEAV
jgi:hypothetical protein